MKKVTKINLDAITSCGTVLDAHEISTLYGGSNNYSVDSNGNFEKSGENAYDYDVVSVGSNSYNVNGSLSFSSYSTATGTPGTEVNGGDYDLFKFLADNTDVEWGATFSGGVNAPGDTSCKIQTTHEDDSCTMQIDANSGHDTMVHSHPNKGSNSPTDEDEATWSELYRSTSIVNYGIYYCQSGRIRDYSK